MIQLFYTISLFAERRQVPVHVPGRLLGGQGQAAVGRLSRHLLTEEQHSNSNTTHSTFSKAGVILDPTFGFNGTSKRDMMKSSTIINEGGAAFVLQSVMICWDI